MSNWIDGIQDRIDAAAKLHSPAGWMSEYGTEYAMKDIPRLLLVARAAKQFALKHESSNLSRFPDRFFDKLQAALRGGEKV